MNLKTMIKRAVAVAAAVVGFGANAATTVTQSMTVDDWPSSGDVELGWVDGGWTLAVDSNEKAAKVAGWDTISFPDNATAIEFSQSDPLTFKAQITSEYGILKSNASGKLTITGDNSGVTNAGSWTFYNTEVKIGHEYAMGPAKSGRYIELNTKDNTKSPGKLTIGWGDGTQKAFTNHVAIKISYSYKDNKATIGSEAADEWFVQDNETYFENGGTTYVQIKGNYEQLKGLFGRPYEKAWGFWIYSGGSGAGNNNRAQLKLSGSSYLIIGYDSATSQDGKSNYLNYDTVDIEYASTEKPHLDAIYISYGLLKLSTPNILYDRHTNKKIFVKNNLWSGSGTGTAYYSNTDMNGCDQTVSQLNTGATSTSTSYYTYTSETPATLTMVNEEGDTISTGVMPVRFTGKVGLTINNGITNQIATTTSITAGDLKIERGLLIFQWGASWTGKDLIISDRGTLSLQSGTSMTVQGAKINGKTLSIGDYTVAQLKASYPGYIEGDDAATISVIGYWEDFDGTGDWPSESAWVQIPANTTVIVDDDTKKASVFAWERLRLQSGAELRFVDLANSQLYDGVIPLYMPISGTGKITAYRSGTVLFAADNREATGTDDWWFEDTNVEIGSDYALGPANSHRIYMQLSSETAAGGKLLINEYWEQNYCTNYAKVYFNAYQKGVIGSRGGDQWFVQAADVDFYQTGGTTYAYICGNYEQIAGHVGRSGTGAWGTRILSDTTFGTPKLKISESGKILGGAASKDNGSDLWITFPTELNVANCMHSKYFRFTGGARVKLGADNAIQSWVSGQANPPLALTSIKTPTAANAAIDLNGHDIHVGNLEFYDRVPGKELDYWAVVKSDTPATIYLDNPTSSGEKSTPAQFIGQVSLYVNNGMINNIKAVKSTSTGTLTVKSGTLRFGAQAGWVGDVVVDGGVFDAESANSLNDFNATLTVTSGSVNLNASSPISVKSATIGGVALTEGRHTGAELKAAYPELVTGDDDGVIEVLGSWTNFDGAGAWPTSGKIYLTGTTALVADTAEKQAALAGWDDLWFENNGSSLLIKDYAGEYTLKANIKGGGNFGATNVTKLVITGDNRSANGTARWNFIDTDVHIGADYALGPKNSHTVRLTKSVDDANVVGGKLTIGWEGQNSFTNRVPVELYAFWSDRIGTLSDEHWFVQEANTYCYMKSGASFLYIQGNFEQAAGFIGRNDTGAWSVQIYGEGSSSHRTKLTLTGDAKIQAGSTESTENGKVAELLLYWLDVELNGSYSVHGRQFTDYGCTIKSLADNSTMSWLSGMYNPQLQFAYNESGSSILDLNGHNETYGSLGPDYRTVISGQSSAYAVVRSTLPATLTLANPKSEDYAPGNAAVKFSGMASLVVDNGFTNKLVNVVSETGGNLTIKNGILTFKWGAGWNGNNVTIQDTGVLNLEADSMLKCNTLTINGNAIANGRYRASVLKAAYPAFVTGDDNVWVMVGTSAGTKLFIW